MKYFFLFITGFLFFHSTIAQDNLSHDGPVIFDYGYTWDISDPGLIIDSNQVFNIVFDVYSIPDDASQVNPAINTLARFLNMHVRAGVKKENISLVAVFHNTAGINIMDNEYYQSKKGVDNPNIELIQKLEAEGVKFYLCGQTMNARKLDREHILTEVKVALSAMTAITKYVSEGYTLIKF